MNLINKLILNRYRVDEFLGGGGMADVYKVWDLRANVPMAMKVLHDDLLEDPSIFKRFKREATALKKLTHPNIVPFYDVHQSSGMAFLLERYVDGPSLKQILYQQPNHRLDLDLTLIVMKCLCAALGFAHANGVVHCDMKPGNVMFDIGGNVYIIDFGIVRHADSTTTTLATLGTAAYMAPEQVRGDSVSPATDVYALGVMLFEMLTGRRPFKGNEPGTEKAGQTANERIRYAQIHLSPPDPRVLNPAIPQALATVILRALEKDPELRYQYAQDFLSAICTAVGTSQKQVPDRIPRARLASLFPQDGFTTTTNFEPKRNGNSYASPTASHGSEPYLEPTEKSGRAGLMVVIGGLILILLAGVALIRSFPPVTTKPTVVYDSTLTSQIVVVVTATPERAMPILVQSTHTVVLTKTSKILPATPTPTPTKRPTHTSRNPTFTPTFSCPGATPFPPQIKVNDTAYVCTQSDNLIIRDVPRRSGEEIVRCPPGTELKIVGGPECADGSTWWYVLLEAGTWVRYGSPDAELFPLPEEQVGWVREGSDSKDMIFLCRR